MPEAYNVGDFYVDSSGVVRGLQPGNQALGQMEKRTASLGSTAQAATAKLFSFHSTALKLASGLGGVAGIAFAVGNAVADLTKDLITGTTWWKNMSEGVTDFYRSAVLGETQLDRLARKAKEFWEGTGVSGAEGTLAQIVKLQEKIFTGLNAVQAEGNATAEAFRAAKSSIREAEAALDALNVKMIKAGVKSISGLSGAERARLEATPREAGNVGLKSVIDMTKMGGAFVPQSQVLKEQNDARQKAIDLADREAEMVRSLNVITMENARARQMYTSAVMAALSPEEQALATIELFDERMVAIAEHTNIAAQAFAALNAPIKAAKDAMGLWLDDLAAMTDAAAVKVQMIQAAMSASIAAMSQVFIQGESGKEALKSLMGAIASACFAMSAMFAAAAIASATGFGAAALQGSPAQFAGAAAGFFAAGVALGAIGQNAGGGAHAGGGGGGGGFASEGGGGRAGPTVHIHVQGSLMGTSPNALGREIMRLLRSAESDGMLLRS